jgi:hypothetical protein
VSEQSQGDQSYSAFRIGWHREGVALQELSLEDLTALLDALHAELAYRRALSAVSR